MFPFRYRNASVKEAIYGFAIFFQCEKYSYEYSGKLDFWDFRYYMNQVEEKMFAVDQDEVRTLFVIVFFVKSVFNYTYA